MIAPTGFQSWKEYFSFVLAREYVSNRTGEVFVFEKGALEKIGRSLSSIGTKPVDYFLKEIRNPLMLLSTTVSALFLTSIVFYPSETWSIATRIFPFIENVKSHHVHACFYGISQSIILGIGMQAYGRLGNHALMQAFQKKEIIPIPIGSQRAHLKNP